ncbi:MAG: YraN family protein [Verrucomicrobia bacterium]|jgi:putative endonuclease|nr:MAG: YraN family protein [Verrucomicrobiota bacterium]
MNTGLVRSIADLSSRWRNRFSRSKELSKRLELGARGEKLASVFLRRQGYKILYRNFRARHGGEVDIICRDKDTLVFVEVKTRRSEQFGRPAEAVNIAKRKLISRGALAWLQLLDNPDIRARFDVVEIILAENEQPRFELIRDAFTLSAPYIY